MRKDYSPRGSNLVLASLSSKVGRVFYLASRKSIQPDEGQLSCVQIMENYFDLARQGEQIIAEGMTKGIPIGRETQRKLNAREEILYRSRLRQWNEQVMSRIEHDLKKIKNPSCLGESEMEFAHGFFISLAQQSLKNLVYYPGE